MNRAIILQNNQPSNATNQSIALEGGSKVDQNGKGKICWEICLLLVDDTVDGSEILNNHLGCIKLCK